LAFPALSEVHGNFIVNFNADLPCAPIAAVYCNLTIFDTTPSVANNDVANCSGTVFNGC
jgi:hypothetical protein